MHCQCWTAQWLPVTSGLPQHAERCHAQHQHHRPVSRVGAETQLLSVSVQFRVIPSSPLCMHTACSRVQHPTTCSRMASGSLQVGSETPTPRREHLMLWSGPSGMFTLLFSLPLCCSVKMQTKGCHSAHSFCNANAMCSLCTCCFPD